MTYSVYIMLHKGIVTKVLPGGQPTREKAEAQLNEAYSHFLQFPGGTQSVAAWVEAD